jgi:acyl dehydratase
VRDARRSGSRPDRGIITTTGELTNQNGDLAMRLTAINFVLLRDPCP